VLSRGLANKVDTTESRAQRKLRPGSSGRLLGTVPVRQNAERRHTHLRRVQM
jgi:hypothetical protein